MRPLYYIGQLSDEVHTFKITTKRADKDFPYDTNEINHMLGGHLLRNTEGLKVDVKNPDLNLLVEIRREAIYLTGEIIQGAGGLPFGSSGKAMLMLSGGIDSPVAGYLSMKRGLDVEAIHFYSPPFTSERSRQKVIDLAEKLAEVYWKYESAYCSVYGNSIIDSKTNTGELFDDNNASINDASSRSNS